MYTLTFDATEKDRRRYELLYQAIVAQREPVKTPDWDDCISLLRAFKRVGLESKDYLAPGVAAWELKDEGGMVFLERSEYRLLLAMLDAPIWRPAVLEEVVEARDWVKAIKNTPKLTEPESKVAGSIGEAQG